MNEMLTKPIDFARLRATLEAHAVLSRRGSDSGVDAASADSRTSARAEFLRHVGHQSRDCTANFGDDPRFLRNLKVFLVSGRDLLRELDAALQGGRPGICQDPPLTS